MHADQTALLDIHNIYIAECIYTNYNAELGHNIFWDQVAAIMLSRQSQSKHIVMISIIHDIILQTAED